MLTPAQLKEVQAAQQKAGIPNGQTPPQDPSSLTGMNAVTAAFSNQQQTPSTSQEPGFISRVGSDLKQQGSTLLNDNENTSVEGGNGTQNIGTTVAEDAAAPLSTVGNLVGEGIKIVGDTLGLSKPYHSVINAIASKVTDNPEITEALNKVNSFLDNNPDVAKDVNSGITTAGFAAGEEPVNNATDTAATAIKGAPGAIADAATSVAEGAKDVAGKAADAIGNSKPVTTLKDLATPIDSRMENLLKSPQAKDLVPIIQKYFDAGREAIKSNSASPFEVAGKEQLPKVFESIQKQLGEHGDTMNDTLAVHGATPVPQEAVSSLEKNLTDNTHDILGSRYEPEVHSSSNKGSFGESIDSLNKSIDGQSSAGEEPVNGKIYNADGRVSKVRTPQDIKLLNQTYQTLDKIKSGSNTFRHVDDLVSNLKSAIEDSKGTGEKPYISPVQKVAANFAKELTVMRDKIGGEDFGTAKDKYSDLLDLKDKLNSAAGDDYKHSASVMKSIFSPTADKRALIERAQQATGVPLFDHANIAKFAMDSLGDPRASSLLENTQAAAKASGSLTDVHTYLNLIQKLFRDPEGKAIRLAKKNK